MKTLAFLFVLLAAGAVFAGDCFNPLVIDRFGAGRIGIPSAYGFQSSVPYAGGAYGSLFGGPRLGDYVGPYGPRVDLYHQQAQLSLTRAKEALGYASGAYRPSAKGFAEILASKCIECHNPLKMSGSLDLSRPESLDCQSLKNILNSVRRQEMRMPLGRAPLDASELSAIESYVISACSAGPGTLPQDNGSNATVTIENTVVKWLEENRASLLKEPSADEILEKLMPVLEEMQKQNMQILKTYIDSKATPSAGEPFEFDIEVDPRRSK